MVSNHLSFTYGFKSPFHTKINGAYPYRIHAMGLGDIDSDSQTEILIQYQTSADDLLSETQLIIFQYLPGKYGDNPEDDMIHQQQLPIILAIQLL
ncbi:MAG: hypothetical protein ACTSSK_18270 [Candidatus Heimdallarchaeota archaeon]